MTDLEKVREWLETFPKFNEISTFSVDYTDQIPANGTFEFPKPWNQSAVLFCFPTNTALTCQPFPAHVDQLTSSD